MLNRWHCFSITDCFLLRLGRLSTNTFLCLLLGAFTIPRNPSCSVLRFASCASVDFSLALARGKRVGMDYPKALAKAVAECPVRWDLPQWSCFAEVACIPEEINAIHENGVFRFASSACEGEDSVFVDFGFISSGLHATSARQFHSEKPHLAGAFRHGFHQCLGVIYTTRLPRASARLKSTLPQEANLSTGQLGSRGMVKAPRRRHKGILFVVPYEGGNKQ